MPDQGRKGSDSMTRRTHISSSLVTLAVLSAAPAMAAGGEGSLFGGDIGNAIWTLVIFLAVIFVLGKFAWGPLLASMQQREEFIRDSLASAKQDREAAEERLQEYSEQLEKARVEASEIVAEGRRDAEAVSQRIQTEAQEETQRMVERAKREIDIARQTAVKELYTLSTTLATNAAGKIVRRELRAEDHERLIAEAIDELERQEAN